MCLNEASSLNNRLNGSTYRWKPDGTFLQIENLISCLFTLPWSFVFVKTAMICSVGEEKQENKVQRAIGIFFQKFYVVISELNNFVDRRFFHLKICGMFGRENQ